MNLAKHAWDTSSVSRMDELLSQHVPKPAETDLRGFEWHYLHRLGRSERLTLKGHSAAIDSLAYSPDGKRMATSAGRETKVWDAHIGKEHLAFNESSGGLTFSPDGKQLATGFRVDRESVVKLWDVETGKELLALKGHTERIGSLAFSPDGKRLACGAGYYPRENETVTVLNAQTGEVLLELKNAGGYVAFSPDGQRLATGRGDSGGKVWDANTGTELLDLPGHSFWSMAYSPDGKHLAGGGDDGATIWDAQTGKELRTIRGQFWSVDNVTFSPDGKHLAGDSWRAVVQILDVQTGEEVRSFKGVTSRVAFSPDGNRLATASSQDNTVKVFDVNQNQEHLSLEGGDGFRSDAFSPDFKRLASGFRDGTVKVRDLQTGQVALALKGHTVRVHAVAFSPDGKRLASGGGGKARGLGWGFSAGDPVELKMWDLETARELLTVPGLTRPVVGLAFSPDGKHLAATIGGGQNSNVTVWDAHNGKELRTLTPRAAGRGAGPPPTVTYSPDGQRLACSRDLAVTVWDAQTGEELLSLRGSSGSAAYSSDGSRLACGGKVWDSQTGQELLNLKGHNTNIYSMTFSPDGKRIASGSRSETKVWDAETGHELLTFGSDGNVDTVAFSPSGHWLASATGGDTIKIRDATPLPEKP